MILVSIMTTSNNHQQFYSPIVELKLHLLNKVVEIQRQNEDRWINKSEKNKSRKSIKYSDALDLYWLPFSHHQAAVYPWDWWSKVPWATFWLHALAVATHPLGWGIFNLTSSGSNTMENFEIANIYSFVKSQVTYRTCYNQSTGYTKYSPPTKHAG